MTNLENTSTVRRLDLDTLERLVCDLVSVQLGIDRNKVLLTSRLVEDLGCDSLELIELLMELEDEFNVTIPSEPDNAVGKSVFARSPFRLEDLAEIVYLQQGTGAPVRSRRKRKTASLPAPIDPFTQLGGRWSSESVELNPALFDELEAMGSSEWQISKANLKGKPDRETNGCRPCRGLG